jgi:hypothetical protein
MLPYISGNNSGHYDRIIPIYNEVIAKFQKKNSGSFGVHRHYGEKSYMSLNFMLTNCFYNIFVILDQATPLASPFLLLFATSSAESMSANV